MNYIYFIFHSPCIHVAIYQRLATFFYLQGQIVNSLNMGLFSLYYNHITLSLLKIKRAVIDNMLVHEWA